MRWVHWMAVAVWTVGSGVVAVGQEPPQEPSEALVAENVTRSVVPHGEPRTDGEARREFAFARQRGLVNGLGLLAGWRRRAALAGPWTGPPTGVPLALPAPPWGLGPWGQAGGWGPWSMFSSGPFGAGYFNPTRQPIGHEMMPDGRGGYSYRPIYEPETVVAPSEPQLPRNSLVEPTPAAEPAVPRRAAPQPTPEEVVPEELPLGNREAVDL